MTYFTSCFRALSLAAVLAAFAIPDASPVLAASPATTTFTVTATVLDSCTVAATTLDFSTYSSASNDAATNTITATCTPTTDYTIALDGGGSEDVTNRSMTGVAHTQSLNYGIYTLVNHVTVWGDGTAGTSTVSGTGNGSAQAITAFGLIPSGQSVDPDTYNDTINVSLAY